jgi:beta-galactosidase
LLPRLASVILNAVKDLVGNRKKGADAMANNGKRVLWIWGLVMLCAPGARAQRIGLDRDWRFLKGAVSGAQQSDFDDSGWRRLDVPHDWSIEDLAPERGPFDPCAPGSCSTGYTLGGTAWYRKHFTLDSDRAGQRVHLHFDGVYMNADVWINGVHLGNHPYGYTAFWHDVTSHVRFGGDNVVAVEVKSEGRNSRWYSGSGIYRPVWLQVTDPVHIEHWGPAVTTPHVSLASAQVRVSTNVLNESNDSKAVTLRSWVLDPNGKTVAGGVTDITLSQDDSHRFDQDLTVSRPSLWSCESPALYTLSQEVKAGDQVLDCRQTVFGIRTIEVDAQNGFRLNGRPVLLKGMCMHHDNYMLGAAAYERAEARRVEITKAAGYNAIRCAHNPPSAAFLDACDRLGMLVIDEAFDQWTRRKNRQDYHLYFNDWWQRDLESMVRRDRNHPSVIMWSIGNEVPEQRSDSGATITAQLVAHIKSLDDTRPVTIGANMAGPVGDTLFAHLDVVGYNYQLADYASDHARVPNRVMYGSETFAREAFEYWAPVEAEPHVIGSFVWTGWDYLGEASIGWCGPTPNWSSTGPYPWHLAYCGEIDACGFKRPAAFYRDVLWRTGYNRVSAFVRSPAPSLPDHDPNNKQLWTYPDIHPSWTWTGHEGEELEVVVYGAGQQVELFLNGKSLGKKPTSRENKYTATWQVPYAPGELKAVGYNEGRADCEWVLKTAGAPARLRLSADRATIQADGCDLSYVTVEVLDAQGIRVPQAENLIRFEVEGQGVLAGVGNGRPYGTESFQRPQRTAFAGRALAVLKSTLQSGTVTLTATSEGLSSDSVVIRTE